MIDRPLTVLALVATLAALCVIPAVAVPPASLGDTSEAAPNPVPLPPVTGPMPQPREIGEPGDSDVAAPDLTTLLARYATLTRTADGETTVTRPSPELAALLETEFATGK